MSLSRHKNTIPWLVVTTLILLLCLYVRWRLLEVPLERDEGEYAYTGQLLLQGIPPYLQAYTMKLPGVSAAYALAMLLFGQTVSGIHVGLLLVNLGGIILVGLLALRLFNVHAALAAAASYALLSLSQSVLGVFAHATHFVVLFALAGLLLMLRHLDTGRLPLLIGSGICLGLAIIMKQHAFLLAGFALLYHAWHIWRAPAGRKPLAANGLFLLAIAAPLALLALVMALAGAFSQFWLWTVRYSADYASSLTVRDGLANLSFMLAKIVPPQLPLWLIAGAGGVAMLARPQLCRDRLLLFGLLIFSFLAICPGFYFREHYFVLLLPAVALLVGAAVEAAEVSLARVRPGWSGIAVSCLLLVLAASYGIYRERDYLLRLPPPQVSRATYGFNPFPESLEVARYIQEHTSPADRVAVLGSEPQIYFYSGRRSATGHIYMYPLMENHRNAERMQREMITEIESARPKYIVVVNKRASWLVTPQSQRIILEWMDYYLASFYEPVGAVTMYDDRTDYRFDIPVADRNQQEDLLILKLKG